MANTVKVGVLVGSLRAGGYSRKTAKALIQLAPESLRCEILEIGQLPYYNQDLEESAPLAWTEFRTRIQECGAFLFVTPEYNRSVPGVLKNAVDVASRPPGHNVWSGKPGAIVSVTPGALGAFGANHHLRQSLVSVNIAAMAQPEAYIARAAGLFGEHDELISDSTQQFFTTFMAAFAAWVLDLTQQARRV